MNKRTHGPFTWVKRESVHGCEIWELVVEPDLPATHFVLKNYGGVPGEGFNGWKLASGGPFDSAGAYDSLEDAIKGVTPWLVDYYKERAAAMRANAQRILNALDNLEKRFNAA